MNMKIFLYFCLLLLLIKKKINCGNTPCFEYSCDECETEEYGKCTKCREGWKLINGMCPCSDSSCALCYSGLAGLHLCILCKNGYYRLNGDCYCDINNCEQCGENTCLKCLSGYFYNSTTNNCEIKKEEDKIYCYDNNCDTCYSTEKGACEKCKDGFMERKGECYELPIPDENNTCPDNFYLSGNNCLEKCSGVDCTTRYHFLFPNYLSCPSNECLICVNNELKIWSECDNSKECSSMEGCLNCITNNECIVCIQGYYLLGGICKKCIDGCSICSNNETCEYCISGYSLNSDNKCNLTNSFDYNINTYSNFKQSLIEYFHPEEIPKETELTTISTEQSETIIQIPSQTIIQSTFPIISNSTIKVNIIPISIPETTTITEINNVVPNLLVCDENCEKCYDSYRKCLECKKLYILKDNKCIKHCTDEKCLDCSLKDETEYCNKCTSGYSPKKEKCVIKCFDEYCKTCTDNGQDCIECEEGKKLFEGKCAQQTCSLYFQYCNYCFGEQKCVECQNGYELDNTGKCIKNSNYISIIFIILGIGIIIIGIISFCIYKKRKNEIGNEIRRMRNHQENQNNVHIYVDRTRNNLNISGSSRSSLSKEDLADEFEKQKRKMEKGNQKCKYCKKKPGKFKCDCGCIVCKDHSSLKKVEGDGENYKVCFACGKIVKRVTAIKYQCNICFTQKLAVVHFKCGCALEVCKPCYIKCKKTNNKCPGCRAII